MISSEERKALLDEIGKYIVVLSSDPTQTGLTESYKILAQVESYKDRVLEILFEALDDVSFREKELHRLTRVYQTSANEKMRQPEINILKSDTLRKAAVDMLLTRDIENSEKASSDVDDAKIFFTKVEHHLNALKDKIRTIKQQIALVGYIHNVSKEMVGDYLKNNRVGPRIQLGDDEDDRS